MASSRTAAKPRKEARMWDTDPRMKKILAQTPGTPIDISVFTLKERRQLVMETLGMFPDAPHPPKAEVDL